MFLVWLGWGRPGQLCRARGSDVLLVLGITLHCCQEPEPVPAAGTWAHPHKVVLPAVFQDGTGCGCSVGSLWEAGGVVPIPRGISRVALGLPWQPAGLQSLMRISLPCS